MNNSDTKHCYCHCCNNILNGNSFGNNGNNTKHGKVIIIIVIIARRITKEADCGQGRHATKSKHTSILPWASTRTLARSRHGFQQLVSRTRLQISGMGAGFKGAESQPRAEEGM